MMTLPKRVRVVPLLTAALLMAATAGAFAATPSYVGSPACAECHEDKYLLLQQSIHSKMIRDASVPGAVHGNLAAPKAPTPADITHVIGGWYKEESYIKKEGDKWTVTNFEWDPIKRIYHNDKPLRDWLVKCAGCHTTGFDPMTKTFSELNIGCEKCHGPGGAHVSSMNAADIKIDRTSEGCGHCHIRAESAEMMGFAAKAFNFPIGYELGKPETLQFIPEPLTVAASFLPDGTSKRHRQQFLDVRGSKHYAKNVSCIKCHDPHTSGIVTTHAALPAGVHGVEIWNNSNGTSQFVAWDGDGLKKPKTDVCKTCHSSVSENHVHYFTDKAQAATITCVDCHMPDIINIDATTMRGALSPHTFRSLRPETALKLGPDTMPASCTYRCHQDKGATKTERALWAASHLSARLELIRAGVAPVTLRLSGVRNFTYAIETSADLTNWSPLATNTAPVSGTFDVSDPDSTSSLLKFYRATER